MALLSWLLVFLLGYSVINSISLKFSFTEKISFAFPVGIAVTTIMMFVFDLAGISLNEPVILLGGIIVMIAGLFMIHRKTFFDLQQFFSSRDYKNFLPKKFNAAWIFLVICILVISALIIVKGQYWIIFTYDSIAGYDFLGRVIAYEGTIHNSIFDLTDPLYSVRDLYPPLVPLSFAFAYATGSFSSQIVISLFFASTVLCFYSLLLRFTDHFAAAIFTLVLSITPQYAAFSSLSSGNIPCMFYCPMSMMCLFIWYEKDDQKFFWLGTLLMAFALWTRTEVIAFAAAGALPVFVKMIRQKKYSGFILYSISCLLIFLAWQIYLSQTLKIGDEQPVVRHIFFDTERVRRMFRQIFVIIFKPELYGIVVWIFFIAIIINIVQLIRNGDRIFLLSTIFLSWILLTGIFYQLDVDYKSIAALTYLTSGYVRAMFYLLPLMLFYVATSHYVVKGFGKLQEA